MTDQTKAIKAYARIYGLLPEGTLYHDVTKDRDPDTKQVIRTRTYIRIKVYRSRVDGLEKKMEDFAKTVEHIFPEVTTKIYAPRIAYCSNRKSPYMLAVTVRLPHQIIKQSA